MELGPPNNPLYQILFQTKRFEVSGPNLPKEFVLGTEFEKSIVKFRISIPEYSFVPSFILYEVLWSFATKLAQKKVF